MLELKQDQAAALIAHAVEEAPNECCGLLAGRHGRVERMYRTTNIHHSPYKYLMDPHEQLAALNDMEAAGLDMMAIYHSHTFTPAYPSTTDERDAYYPDTDYVPLHPGALYVIVSLASPEVPAIRAYHLTDGKIAEERVVVR